MKIERRVIYLLVVCFFILINGCKKSIIEEDINPLVSLVYRTECKMFVMNTSSNDTFVPMKHDDCVEYVYDNGVLNLYHVNAGFNCCPGEILFDVGVNGREITIMEQEKEAGCYCLCLFDLTYEIKNLKPGIYTIIIDEPYVNESDDKLEFTINLQTSPSGSYCVERKSYPWE